MIAAAMRCVSHNVSIVGASVALTASGTRETAVPNTASPIERLSGRLAHRAEPVARMMPTTAPSRVSAANPPSGMGRGSDRPIL